MKFSALIRLIIAVEIVYECIPAEPTWSVYPANVMYSGEIVAISSVSTIGLQTTRTQPIYRNDVTAAQKYTSAPKVILSLLGYKQNAPSDGNTFVGFDVKISAIRATQFDYFQNIYGATVVYMNYMYLTILSTNTDFNVGQYSQLFDTTQANKSYSIDIAYNSGQSYPNYLTNKIQMKGFLAGYKIQQGTAPGFQLNFNIKVKDASYFTIQVSTNVNSVLEKIWFYRIGYDRTAIQRKSYNDVFRDVYFQLKDNVNTLSIYNVTWGSLTQFQYRNFLMGTNKINIEGTIPLSVQFFLYYYFAQSLAKLDLVDPKFIDNPAKAKYLYANTFYHAARSCSTSPYNYFTYSDRKCNSACPATGFFTDTTYGACIECHFTCKTCSAPYLLDKCLSCDTNFRVYNSGTNKCDCPLQKFDDSVNLACPSCHATCLTCVGTSQNSCKSCDSSAFRDFSDPDNDGIGNCICSQTYYENNSGQCTKCGFGCLTCSVTGGVQTCSSCSSVLHTQLDQGRCVCSNGYDLVNGACVLCHYTCKRCSAASLANKCISCDTNFRVYNSVNEKCQCPSRKYDDGTNLACPSCHATCLTCIGSSQTSCKLCDSLAFREFSDPDNDGIGNCICKQAYYENNTGQCAKCGFGCLTCTVTGGVQTCFSCDSILHTQLDQGRCVCRSGYDLVNGACVLCHYTCKGCSAGSMSNRCTSCDTNFRKYNSGNNTCECPQQTYDDGNNIQCASCHYSCLTCSGPSFDSCVSCDVSKFRFFSDPNNDGIGSCICASTYSENSSGFCSKCGFGCLSCTVAGGVQTCLTCDTTIYTKLSQGQCICESTYDRVGTTCLAEKCGDGFKTKSQQCDDNNAIDNDGCSSICKVQPNHVCIDNATISPHSICYFNGSITMTITQVIKDPYQNQVSLSLKISAESVNEDFLESYLTGSPSIVLEDITQRLLVQQRSLASSDNLKINSIRFDRKNQMLYVSFQYDQSFDITTKKIRFQPSQSVSGSSIKYFYNSPQAIVQLKTSYNKIDTTYYNKSDYERARTFKIAFLVLIIAHWLGALIFIGFGKGNVAMEMMIVLQLAYMTLLSQSSLQINFGGLSQYGKYTAGFNTQIEALSGECPNFVSIDLKCSLINNLNVSVILMAFLVILYWSLKLTNKLLNDRGQRIFNQKKHRRYMERNNERTDQNINPSIPYGQEESPVSESSQALEQNYYKDKQFIPQRAYNLILDLIFFLIFITVGIWAMSLCFLKQNTLASIIEGAIVGVVYLMCWVFWFLKYFTLDFSFVQAHKSKQTAYKDEDQSESEVSENKNMEQPNKEEQRMQPTAKSKCSPIIFKVLFYPLIWISLLCISIILAKTEAIGYITEGLIIAGSALALLTIWLTGIYKQKLNMIRSIINCVSLILIETAYMISQSDYAVGTGLPITIVIFVLLCLNFLSNSISTFYLFSVELKLSQKHQESKEIENIENEIKRLQELKRQKQIQQHGFAFKMSNHKSSIKSSSHYNQTVKKEVNYYQNNNIADNFNQSCATELKNVMTKEQINQILSKNRLQRSEPYLPEMKKTIALGNLHEDSAQKMNDSRNTFITQKKRLFAPSSNPNFLQEKYKSQTKVYVPHDLIERSEIQLKVQQERI